jgi:hypothetical protein
VSLNRPNAIPPSSGSQQTVWLGREVLSGGWLGRRHTSPIVWDKIECWLPWCWVFVKCREAGLWVACSRFGFFHADLHLFCMLQLQLCAKTLEGCMLVRTRWTVPVVQIATVYMGYQGTIVSALESFLCPQSSQIIYFYTGTAVCFVWPLCYLPVVWLAHPEECRPEVGGRIHSIIISLFTSSSSCIHAFKLSYRRRIDWCWRE